MEIRECTTGDFESVVRLLRQLWPQKPLNLTALRAVFDAGLRSGVQRFLCVVEDGSIAGFCSVLLENSLWVEGNLALIEELVVDERQRGHGVGRALLVAASDWARSQGAHRIELDSAHHRKEAHRFYEENGFEDRGLVFSKALD